MKDKLVDIAQSEWDDICSRLRDLEETINGHSLINGHSFGFDPYGLKKRVEDMKAHILVLRDMVASLRDVDCLCKQREHGKIIHEEDCYIETLRKVVNEK